MGRDASCRARWGSRTSQGWAYLGSTDLRFRGDFHLKIPFAEIRSLTVRDGVLRVRTAGGTAELEPGPAAEKWADSIRNPKSVIEKLGIEPGMKVSALRVGDGAFLRDARAAAGDLSEGRALAGADLIFLGVEKTSDLDRLTKLRDTIHRDGGIWVVWPKGQPHIKEDHARAAGRAAGLVDVKVVAFSPTHGALKLVIPKRSRGGRTVTGAPTARATNTIRKGAATPAAVPLVVPAELKRALARSKAAKARFDAFPPSHRREIAGYVAEAKTPETRARRATQTVEKLASGTWKSG